MATIDIVSEALYSRKKIIHTTTVDGENLYLFTGGLIYWDEFPRAHGRDTSPCWRYELWSTDEYGALVDLIDSGELTTIGDLQRVIEHAVDEALNPSATSEDQEEE